MDFFSEHTTVSIVVNNVALEKKKKQPQAIHLASSETRKCSATKLGDMIATSNSD